MNAKSDVSERCKDYYMKNNTKKQRKQYHFSSGYSKMRKLKCRKKKIQLRKKKMLKNRGQIKRTIEEYMVLTVATLILVVGVYVFKFPNNFSFG